MSTEASDALTLFRACVAESSVPMPLRSADVSSASDAAPFAEATHLLFNTQSATEGAQHTALPLSTVTRFVSQANGALDLASVFWCWHNKDKGTGDYIAATQEVNTARTAKGLSGVRNLVFAEKLDLINWLSGENDSEFIKSLDDNRQTRAQAQDAAKMASGDGDVVMQDVRPEDDKLREIYSLERITGDRNTVLRGSKATVGAQLQLLLLIQSANHILCRTSRMCANMQRPSWAAPSHLLPLLLSSHQLPPFVQPSLLVAVLNQSSSSRHLLRHFSACQTSSPSSWMVSTLLRLRPPRPV